MPGHFCPRQLARFVLKRLLAPAGIMHQLRCQPSQPLLRVGSLPEKTSVARLRLEKVYDLRLEYPDASVPPVARSGPFATFYSCWKRKPLFKPYVMVSDPLQQTIQISITVKNVPAGKSVRSPCPAGPAVFHTKAAISDLMGPLNRQTSINSEKAVLGKSFLGHRLLCRYSIYDAQIAPVGGNSPCEKRLDSSQQTSACSRFIRRAP